MTILTWGNIPATMGGGSLANHFGNLGVFLAGTLCMAAGMAGTALSGWPLGWCVIVGVLGGIQPGVIMAVGTLSARPENRAVGMGVFYTVYYLGGVTIPVLCGAAADAYGGPAGGLLGASALAVCGVPLFLAHRALARRWAPVRAMAVG
jgi:MFS family permease